MFGLSGWAFINFLGFQGGCLFKVGTYQYKATLIIYKALPGKNYFALIFFNHKESASQKPKTTDISLSKFTGME